jgi:3-keto-disaccharide hydrolase
MSMHLVKLTIAAGMMAGVLQGQPASEWRSLFDGKSLAGWKPSDFFGAGKVTVADGMITLGSGALTGINWAGVSPPFPTSNYEVRIEAARMKGSDFFAGITFPVKDSYCTWINGGWGGKVVGLSSIDGADASQNETTFTRDFETGRWYSLRLRVTPTTISAWIDGELAIELPIGKKWIALREGEIGYSVPFGIAAYSTTAAVRKIDWRPL